MEIKGERERKRKKANAHHSRTGLIPLFFFFSSFFLQVFFFLFSCIFVLVLAMKQPTVGRSKVTAGVKWSLLLLMLLTLLLLLPLLLLRFLGEGFSVVGQRVVLERFQWVRRHRRRRQRRFGLQQALLLLAGRAAGSARVAVHRLVHRIGEIGRLHS